MMGAGLLNTTMSFNLVALKFCFPGSITSFHRFVYVFFFKSIPLPGCFHRLNWSGLFSSPHGWRRGSADYYDKPFYGIVY